MKCRANQTSGSTATSSRAARAIRFIVTAAIVAAACYLAYGFGRLWAQWRQASLPRAVVQASNGDASMMAPPLPLAGHWAFGELDWNLRSNAVNRADITARFDALAETRADATDDNLDDVAERLVELARDLRIEPTEHGDCRLYRADRPEFKAQLVVRSRSDRLQLISLAAAFPKQGDQWQLVEFKPASATKNKQTSVPFLLPLPAGAERDGGRYADDGRVLLEFVTVDATADELIDQWKSTGWEVRPSGLGGAGDFSNLCRRGNEVIYAWSPDERSALRRVMLVRSPSASDTSGR
jgi:hypothetical protein